MRHYLQPILESAETHLQGGTARVVVSAMEYQVEKLFYASNLLNSRPKLTDQFDPLVTNEKLLPMLKERLAG